MTDALKNYYENEGDESLRMQENSPQYTEFLTLTKYFDRLLKPNSQILDPCAGTGVYAFYLADKGHTVTAGDLFKVNVDALHQQQAQRLQQPGAAHLAQVYQGDVLDLSAYDNASFDAVLCMGALYHMEDPARRHKAIEQCLRVLRPGGIFVATYINRHAAIAGNCHEDIADIADMLEFLDKGVAGVFFTHTPTLLEEELSPFSLERLLHIGADGIGYLLHGQPPIISYEGLLKWRQLHFATCEVRELLGYSYHGAYFGRKL